MKRCPQCGKQYSTEANFCPIDAGRLEELPDDASAEPDDQVLGGRFAIGEHLGDGGKTGQVFEGTDNQTGQPCVIKWVDRDVFASPLQMQRTERELKQLERATSTNIARILGHGRKGERLWYASERVGDARSLRDIVADSGPLDSQRAAKLVHAVGTALAEAAKLGVIHRDVAPKNVLVGEDDAVKVVNFGVAVPTTPSVRGVPEYVAPEQVDGKPVDQRSNIYSLGAMFFFLVTGRPPFEGDVQAVHSAHLHTPPPKASEHAEVGAEVDRLIDRALAKQSSKRYMTLRQLLGELGKIAGVEASATVKLASLGKQPQKKQESAAAATMLGVGALSAETESEGAAAMGVAALAPPVEGRTARDSVQTEVDEGAKTNKVAVVSSRDSASTSGEIGGADAEAREPEPSEAEPAVDDSDRPKPVAGEIGGDTESDEDGDDEGRATVKTKRKKRRRRRRRRRRRASTAGGSASEDSSSADSGDGDSTEDEWFEQGESDESDETDDIDETEDDDRPETDAPPRRRERAAARSASESKPVSEKELADEMAGGHTRLLIAGGVALVVVATIVALAMS